MKSVLVAKSFADIFDDDRLAAPVADDDDVRATRIAPLGECCSGKSIGHVLRIDRRRQDNAAFFDRVRFTELSTKIQKEWKKNEYTIYKQQQQQQPH